MNIKWYCFVLAVGMLSSSVDASMIGTRHDLRGYGWTDGEICKPCHVPHNAYPYTGGVAAFGVPPLWNHQMSSQTFTVYASPTGTLDAGPLAQPTAVSLACLSCHDGVTAMDNFGGTTTGTAVMVTAVTVIGTNLNNDHPISFTYDTALAAADGGLHDPATTSANIPGKPGTIQERMLFNGRMECSSCHSIHDDTNGKFLIKSNAGSALCLTCHNK